MISLSFLYNYYNNSIVCFPTTFVSVPLTLKRSYDRDKVTLEKIVTTWLGYFQVAIV